MNPTTKTNYRAMLRLRYFLAMLIASFLTSVGVQGQSVLNVSDDYTSIQAAIEAANPGDTLVMSSGTFTPTATIELNKPGVVLRGAGADQTFIDISGFDAWGIHISADSVMCQNFSILGDAAANQQYAIHTTPGIHFARVVNVNVSGNHRTGVDFNGVSGGVIRGVSSTGAASGFGISISSCENLVIRDINTADNAWGDVAIFPAQTQYQVGIEAPSNIRFLDSLSISSGVITVQPGALDSGGTWDPVISTTDATDALYAAPADVRVPERMIYTAQATRLSDGLDNRIVGTPEDVLAVMELIEASGAFGPQTFTNLETGDTTSYALGCMDATSCSYDSTATVMDAAACTYPAEAWLDCNGDCIADIDGDGLCDALDNCTDATACNYDDATATECETFDAIGDCGGSCTADADSDGLCDDADNCFDLTSCNYDSASNGVCQYTDACGICGGTGNDVDGDGICDANDECIGVLDSCGVCNGPGAVYTCGCAEIPAGDCDCNGNTLDALGVCGGDCIADADGDGVCDDVDACIGVVDSCGVCNGPGANLECGCFDLPAGDCDCNGNQLDVVGVCGGDCAADTDGDGICDTADNCTDTAACNYANGANGTCQYEDACGICGGSGTDADGDGVCDSSDNCTDLTACNYADVSNGVCQYADACGICGGPSVDLDLDGLCEHPDSTINMDNCADTLACNFMDPANEDCLYLDLCGVCGGGDDSDTNNNQICDDEEESGCMDPDAINFNPNATLSTDVCEYFTATCIPEFDPTIDDTLLVSCVGDLPLEAPAQYAYDPCTVGNPSVDVLSSMVDMDTTTACGQFVTYRYVALNLNYGLIAVQYQTYMVSDTVGPVISSVPVDLVIACTDDSTAYGAVTAVDGCHDVLDITYAVDTTYVDSTVVLCPGNFVIERTVTARDVCLNVSTAQYAITVRDLVAPVLGNVPADDTLSCEAPIPSDLPVHQDNCGVSTMSVSMTELPGSCPENFTLIRTFTAEDECGNAASAIQEVVFIDTVAPVILSTPDNLVLACEETVADSAITASDNCSDIAISWMDSVAAGTCPQEYTIYRTHTALDACGNSVSHVQEIEVEDNAAPEFIDLEDFVSASCSEATGAFAVAEDTCSSVLVTFAAFSAYGAATPGQQIRLYTATDECGNSTEGIQLVSFTDAENCSGCTNETALNYDASAILNDGSCNFGGVYTQGGECNVDTDGDGVCDQLEIPGCTDPNACNYVAIATDSAACTYPTDPERNCSGVCLNDADGDGICDGNELAGCMDTNACNFNLYATDSDPASCNYGCQGCTYTEAENYDAGSTMDDGSCTFDLTEVVNSTCDGDANGDGQVSITDLLDVLDAFGSTCD